MIYFEVLNNRTVANGRSYTEGRKIQINRRAYMRIRNLYYSEYAYEFIVMGG